MSTTFHEHGWECNFIIYLSNSSKVDYANTIIFNHIHSNNKSRIIFLLVIHICSKNTLDANLMYLVIQLSQQATGISTLLLFLLDFHDKGNRLSFQNENPIFNINLSKAKNINSPHTWSIRISRISGSICQATCVIRLN